MEPAISMDSKTTFGFKMKEGAITWLAVGMCQKNKIISNNYGFPYSNLGNINLYFILILGHGAYMISSNAGTWSSLSAG